MLAPGSSRGVLAFALILLCGASLATASTDPAPAEAGGGWREKVHPLVLERAADGPVDFLLFLNDQLSPRADSPRLDKNERTRRVADQLRSHAERTQSPVVERLKQLGVEYRSYWIANLIWVRADASVLEKLAALPEVRRVDANPEVPVALPASEPLAAGAHSAAGIEWNIAQVHADELWTMGYLGDGVVVAGQDTGYQWDHPALKAQYRGWNGVSATHDHHWHDAIHSGGGVCGPDSVQPCDDSTHGTHTMGSIVGDDGAVNRIGMAPHARWIGCRNMNLGIGTPQSYIECFQWFVAPTDLSGQNPDPALAPDVINNSWLCPAVEGCSQDTLQTVVRNTRAAGIVVVVAAGNSGPTCSTVSNPPAHYAGSFSVGATSSTDTIASFSSRGPVTVDGSGRMKPEVSAPGVSVRSSVPTDGYSIKSGTSMAGPHVVGLVALLLSARPDLKGRVGEIETVIESSALALTTTEGCGGDATDAVPNNTYGHGRIDATQMLVADADGDGVSNLDDCSPVSPEAWETPSPARDLTANADGGGTFWWDAPASPGSTSVTYDLLRSPVSQDFGAAQCVASDLAQTTATDPAPVSGIAYYLVRANNVCGDSLGLSAAGQPRAGATCP
jgi:subtilisin family serine protease